MQAIDAKHEHVQARDEQLTCCCSGHVGAPADMHCAPCERRGGGEGKVARP